MTWLFEWKLRETQGKYFKLFCLKPVYTKKLVKQKLLREKVRVKMKWEAFPKTLLVTEGMGQGHNSRLWDEIECVFAEQDVYFSFCSIIFLILLYIFCLCLPELLTNKAIKSCRVTIGRVSLSDLSILIVSNVGTVSLDFIKAFINRYFQEQEPFLFVTDYYDYPFCFSNETAWNSRKIRSNSYTGS